MKTILVIDDNEMMRENTVEILQLSNYLVLTAENGKKGLRLARNKKPDLIICDMMIPEMDGLPLLKKIRESERINKTPFILITAPTEKADIINGFDHGMSQYLAKPFAGDELLRVVAKFLPFIVFVFMVAQYLLSTGMIFIVKV